MIVAIDAGNSEVKVASERGLDRFNSAIGEYRKRKIADKHGKDDMIFKYGERRGFAGTLALFESEYGGAIMGESKAHDDAKLRVLLALHRLGVSDTYDIVVYQPIGMHTETEKDAIKRMLKGEHEITVNNSKKKFEITNVTVAAEGGAAFWSKPQTGIVRIIDVGGATVNYATFIDKRFVDRDSGTLSFGLKSVKNADPNELVRGVVRETSKKWNPNDLVYVVGGAANGLTPIIAQYYPNAVTLNPFVKGQEVDAIYANAVGGLAIGSAVYAQRY